MYKLDNVDLDNLTQDERDAVVKILEEISSTGTSELYKELLYADYDEIPVGIDEFLHNPIYLGKGLINEEGKFTVFPYWVEVLKKYFLILYYLLNIIH